MRCGKPHLKQGKQRALEGRPPDACGLLLDVNGNVHTRGMVALDKTRLTHHPSFTPL
jgi:hypothetical protein